MSNPEAESGYSIASLTLSSASIVGGGTLVGTLHLNKAAATGGETVSVVIEGPNATAPYAVTVPAGSSSASFVVSTTPVTVQSVVGITAAVGTSFRSASLQINPAVLTSLQLSPSSVAGGTGASGTVKLNGPAPTGGLRVTLSSSSPDATVPSSVLIPAGASSATFAIATAKVTATTKATITATLPPHTLTATLTIT